ncbi:hypothetical protein MN608_11953 [Microdochium nivale]|nr:hypothetical protein MN608_11953 [Microdochium nivale]
MPLVPPPDYAVDPTLQEVGLERARRGRAAQADETYFIQWGSNIENNIRDNDDEAEDGFIPPPYSPIGPSPAVTATGLAECCADGKVTSGTSSAWIYFHRHRNVENEGNNDDVLERLNTAAASISVPWLSPSLSSSSPNAMSRSDLWGQPWVGLFGTAVLVNR